MNNLDSSLNFVGQTFEARFRACKDLPQYKYFTMPIYKFCVNKIGTVAATGVSFLAADLIIHQLIPQTIGCLASQVIPNDWQDNLGLEDLCDLSYSYTATLYWAAFAIPVMYAKYKRNKTYSPKVSDQFSATVEAVKNYAWQSLEKVSNSLKISSLKFSEGSPLNSVVSLFKQMYPAPEEVPTRLLQQPVLDFGFEKEHPQPGMAAQQKAPIVEFVEPMGYEEIAAPIPEQPIQKRVVKQRRRVEPTMPKRVQPDRTAKAKISPNFYAVRTYREMDQFMQRNRASRYN